MNHIKTHKIEDASLASWPCLNFHQYQLLPFCPLICDHYPFTMQAAGRLHSLPINRRIQDTGCFPPNVIFLNVISQFLVIIKSSVKKCLKGISMQFLKKMIFDFVTIAVFEQIMMFLNIMDSDHYPASKY